MSQSKVVIAFGGNTGETLDYFLRAKADLERLIGPAISVSKTYRTAPMVSAGADPKKFSEYYNAAVLFGTTLTPLEVLDACLKVEQVYGRTRTADSKWQSRTIDLDLIAYDDQVINEPNLTVPHPEMHKRDFVLIPLHEILPTYTHPILKKNVSELIETIPARFVLGAV